MPVDPSGVTTDDHGQGGGGAEQQPEGSTSGSGPVADPRAGLPPVAGSVPAGGNGSNGHDEAGLPPTGGTGVTDRLDGDPLGSDSGVADTEARPQGWATSADREPEGGAQRYGEVPPGESLSPWSSASHSAPAPASAVTENASAGLPPAAITTRGPAIGPEVDASGADLPGDGARDAGTGRRLAARGRLRRNRKRKARRGLRVRQRLWSIDPWSVFKLSVLFYICVCLIVVVAGTLLWNVGRSVGTIDDVEGFVTRMGAYGTCTLKAELPAGTEFEEDDDCAEGEVLVGGYKFDDGTLFRVAAIGGGILVVAGSIGNVLMVVLLNLLNELTGGLRYTVVKEPIPRPPGARQRGGRPPGARAAVGQAGGPRHAARNRPSATSPADDVGDGGDGDEPVRVPVVEGSTDRGPQG
jgi:Transmembrane domain of unknown function (DUF3566)